MTDKTENDFIGDGWHRLDPDLTKGKPPKINWGERYKTWPNDKKIKYLEELAASMNHAAFLIQNERDELNTLCGQKEEMLNTLSQNLEGNNGMIQQQIMLLNEERQTWNKAAVEMKVNIRQLEKELAEYRPSPLNK